MRGRPRLISTVLAAAAALLAVAAAPAVAATRSYWIAAVPISWNVVPSGHDAIMHMRYPRSQTVLRTVVYRRFTPGWKRALPDRDQVGIDGPLLRARVGDRIVVHFLNRDTLRRDPHSMHFHGVSYRPSSDGSYLPGFSGPDAVVQPGRSWTYRLTAGPDSAGVWPYHDHSPSMDDSIAGGMYGALSIRGRGERAPDREFVVFLAQTLGFMTIDGRAFVGNTPVFHARVGDLVQWDVLTLGDAFHTFHVHGHRWRAPGGVTRDTVTIGPAESMRIRWREDAPGTWMYHCHVESHMNMGMIGIYRVAPR
ncbi:MAG: multicopper oxidase domain-containing protein [Actinobacteria bacterium]|nr:multicopper oxidase domain-containing protein [Actinomycetota bacterium]